MKMVRAFVIGVSALGLAATPAFAQQQQDQQQRQAQDQQQQDQRRAALIAADTLRGADVRDQQGQNIGSIDELRVDPQTGRIEQVVVSPGAVLGIGRDPVHVTWQNVNVKRDNQQVVVTMDRQAVGTDPAASPRPADQQQQPAQAQQRFVDIDDIEGANLRDAQGQDLGSVHRVMIDPDQGEIAYVVVATGGFLGIGRDYVQIPWQNLQARWDNGDVLLTAERPLLEQAPEAQRGWIRDGAPAASPAQPAPAQPGQPQYQQQQPQQRQ